MLSEKGVTNHLDLDAAIKTMLDFGAFLGNCSETQSQAL
jgi:hypothetical protein